VVHINLFTITVNTICTIGYLIQEKMCYVLRIGMTLPLEVVVRILRLEPSIKPLLFFGNTKQLKNLYIAYLPCTGFLRNIKSLKVFE
jgi:hypothetical protein